MPARISRPKTATAYDHHATSTKSNKHRKRKKFDRSLNAFAIASAEHPDAEQARLRRHRLASEDERGVEPLDSPEDTYEDGESGEDADGPRRKRQRFTTRDEDDDDEDDDDDDEGQDEDEDIDSDEAFGESDEERYEGFAFRGSKSAPRKRQSPDLDEEDEVEGDNDEDLEDDEDAVDLAHMLDRDEDDDDEESEDSEDEEGKDSEREQNEKVKDLQRFVSSLPSASKDADSQAVQSVQPTAARMLAALKTMPSVNSAFAHSLKKFSAAAESASAPSTSNTKPTRNGLVQPPLPKRQQDRIDRAVAYDKAKEQLDEWLNTVKHNRRAEHLSFPLHDALTDTPLGTAQLLEIQPQNDLEKAISAILQESGLSGSAESEEKRIRDAETSQLTANKVPLEEILARRAQLRRERDLLFHEERRAKRINKIKSKAYRRVHRKEAERAAQKEKKLLEDAGLVDDVEEQEKLDRRRAEERMGQRFRESKWARGAKDAGRLKWDEEAQADVVDRARRAEELKKRIEGSVVTSQGADGMDSDEVSEESDEDQDLDEDFKLRRDLEEVASELVGSEKEEKGSKLASMKFMQRAEAARRQQNDEAVQQLRRELAASSGGGEMSGSEGSQEESNNDDEGEQMQVMRKVFGANTSMKETENTPEKIPQTARSELEECFSSEDDNAIILEQEHEQAHVDSKKKSEPSARISSNEQKKEQLKFRGVAKAYGSVSTSINDASKKTSKRSKTAIMTAPPSDLNSWKSVSIPNDISSTAVDKEEQEDRDAEMPFVSPTNLELVQAAFGGGEQASAEFAAEKAAAEASEDDQVTSSAMPGWGSWTGEGLNKRDKMHARIKLSDPRYQKKTAGVKPEKRKDARLDRVIISEKHVRKNAKYLASSLPHPFETKLQYERSLRLPIGPEWTTKETFQKTTKPRVLIKGGIIKPMEKPLI